MGTRPRFFCPWQNMSFMYESNARRDWFKPKETFLRLQLTTIGRSGPGVYGSEVCLDLLFTSFSKTGHFDLTKRQRWRAYYDLRCWGGHRRPLQGHCHLRRIGRITADLQRPPTRTDRRRLKQDLHYRRRLGQNHKGDCRGPAQGE